MNAAQMCGHRPHRGRHQGLFRSLCLGLCLGLYLGSGLAAVMAQETPVPVTTQAATALAFHPQREAAATVMARNETMLSAEIQGKVLWIGPSIGATVAADTPLLRLDCRDAQSAVTAQQAALEGVQARLRFSQAQLRRAEELQGRTLISDEEMDRRRMEQASLQAESATQREAAAQARWRVERCEIRAPFPAAIQQRLVGVGALATPGQPLLHLVELADLEVQAALPPSWSAEAAATDSARFVWLGQEYPLTWQRTASWIDSGTRLRELRYGFAGNEPLPPPGAVGRLQWSSAQPHLPAELLLRREQQLGVFVRADDHARFVPLPGAQEGQPVPASPVLGAEIIVAGRHRLQDGALIQVQPHDTPP